MTLEAGSRLGPYVVVAPLGAGGMGEVYRARDPRLERDVALKVLPDALARHPDRLRRFAAEAKAVAALNHPAILAIFDVGTEGEIPYLVTELLEGRSLRDALSAGPIPRRRALDLIRQAAAGLAVAHEKGIVHRDIKPENLFLTTDDRIKVLDFGLARRAGPPLPGEVDPDGPTAAGTRPGALLGTVGYMSPEQVRGEVADQRTDVFSLGCVLYEMLTGRRAFRGDTAAETMTAILREDPLEPAPGHPSVPPPLERVLRHCLEKAPERRFHSAHDLALALDALSGPSDGPDAENGPPLRETGRRGLPGPGRLPARPTRLRAAPGAFRPAVAALLLVLLATLWWGAQALVGTAEPAPKVGGPLVVAITPFEGPDEDSAKEGRVMAALVEKAIAGRLPPGEVTVLGIDRTRQAVGDHVAARALAERLGARIVVWGEVIAIRGETEIQPYFTFVPGSPPVAPTATGRAGGDVLASLRERSLESLVVGAGAPDQIEARRTTAGGVGELVLVLAAAHALYADERPQKALALLAEAPRSSETLRYRAEALVALRRPVEARRALEEAVLLAPGDAQAWAALGDFDLVAGRRKEARDAYARAARTGAAFSARQGILFEGKLYVRERGSTATGEAFDSGYLLAEDPESGTVVERHLLPGVVVSMAVRNGALAVDCQEAPTGTGRAVSATLRIADGRVLGRRSLSAGLGLRHMGVMSGQRVAADSASRGGNQTGLGHEERLAALDSALRQARDRDPTQPWHLFHLGVVAWRRDRPAEAEGSWEGLLDPAAFPGIPYYEYAWMALQFEELGQPRWADEAYREALRRRRQMPQPIGRVLFLERLVNTPFVRDLPPARSDPDRRHLWLQRAREFGLSTEKDDFAAAFWEGHFRARGLAEKADAEATVRREAQRDPLNAVQLAAGVDHAFQLHAALGLAFLVAVTSLLAAGSRRRRAMPAGSLARPVAGAFVRPDERRTLLVACTLSLLAAALFLGRAHVLWRVGYLPYGFGDALGSASVGDELERLVAKTPSRGARFALAVSSHLAGRVDRARTLYESLLDDPRARRNLAALRAGSLTPPEPVRSEDLREAYTDLSWKALPRAGLEAAGGFARMLLIGRTSGEASAAAVLGGLVPLLAVVLLLLVSLWSPVAGPAPGADERRPSLWSRCVPGLADLTGGNPGRGYVALATGTFAATAVVSQLFYAADLAVGPATADASSSWWRSFALPERSFWTELWTYRDTPVFWGAALVAAAVSIGLHLTAGRHRRHTGPQSPAVEPAT